MKGEEAPLHFHFTQLIMSQRLLLLLLTALTLQACTTPRAGSEEKPALHSVEHDPRTRTQEPTPSRVR